MARPGPAAGRRRRRGLRQLGAAEPRAGAGAEPSLAGSGRRRPARRTATMSMFGKLFGAGGGKAGKGGPTPQEAIQRLRDTEEMLSKKQEFLEEKIEQELTAAKKHGTKNKRGESACAPPPRPPRLVRRPRPELLRQTCPRVPWTQEFSPSDSLPCLSVSLSLGLFLRETCFPALTPQALTQTLISLQFLSPSLLLSHPPFPSPSGLPSPTFPDLVACLLLAHFVPLYPRPNPLMPFLVPPLES